MPKPKPEATPEETKEPKPKAENPAPLRFVEKTAQSLIRWSPMGSATGLLAHAVLNQNWLMALVSFPVTVASVVWANYSEGFTDKLGEIYRGRGTNDAEGLVKWLDTLDETVRWQLSGFDQKYLQSQGNQCRGYIIEGFNPEGASIDLDEVFVPLEIRDEFISCNDGRRLAMLPGFRRNLKDEATGRDIWELLAETPRSPSLKQMAILALGGYGKTTLMRHITYTYAQGKPRPYNAPKLTPVLLYLRKFQTVIAELTLTLPELITEHHLKNLPGIKDIKSPPGWAKLLLRQGKALVMFDGFDEVAQDLRPAVSAWITYQMQQYDKSVSILTSRPGGYDHYIAEKPTTKLRVKPFTPKQQREFIEKWYLAKEGNPKDKQQRRYFAQVAQEKAENLIEQIEDRQDLKDMAINPLLLNMIAFFHRFSSSNELPTYRAELYREICKLQLGDRPRLRAIKLSLDTAESQQVLQGLALEMMKESQERLVRSEMIKALTPKLQAVDNSVDVKKFLDEITEVSELLVEAEQGEYEFAHLSFQAFLAAAEIERLKQEDFLVQKSQADDKDWWKDTTLFYVGLVRNPANLLQKLLDRGSVNLAYEYRKNTAKKIDKATEDRLEQLDIAIRDRRYQRLERFMKNEQWQEADYETYQVMIEILGTEEGNCLRKEELLNFPCEDLLAIDELWVKHSQGKFGFSIQKEIIKNCGYKLEGSDPPTMIVWYDFLDQVGWRNKKTGVWWEPIYVLDIDSKTGTLPFRWRRAEIIYSRSANREEQQQKRDSEVVGLFSRIDICQL